MCYNKNWQGNRPAFGFYDRRHLGFLANLFLPFE
jgi:hypothetical protein